MATLYRIKDWDRYYEYSETRRGKIKHMHWVKLLTQHDNLKYRRLIEGDKGLEHFAIWILLLQIAAKCSPRGTLQSDGKPLTPDDLRIMSGAPPEAFVSALPVLANLGWIEELEHTSGDNPETVRSTAGVAPATDRENRQTESKPVSSRDTGLPTDKQTETEASSSSSAGSPASSSAPGPILYPFTCPRCNQVFDCHGEDTDLYPLCPACEAIEHPGSRG